MPKIAADLKCAKCGSDRIRQDELTLFKHGMAIGRKSNFDVFICEECGYSEFFYR
jgi:predicted nucleic-acid-binding Zn-ribbon protein